jgi:hypothetical protein
MSNQADVDKGPETGLGCAMTDIQPRQGIRASLRSAWERVKAFGRTVDSCGAENAAWSYQTRIQRRRIAWDAFTGKLDDATAERLYQESGQERRNAWRAFRPDPSEPD